MDRRSPRRPRSSREYRDRRRGYRRQRRDDYDSRTYPCPAPWESNSAQPEGSWIYADQPAPTSDELENLRDARATPVKPSLQLEIDEAFGLASTALADSKTTKVHCLDPRRRPRYDPHFLPLVVFNELDELLFRSVLKGNVYIVVASLPDGVEARTSRTGLHKRPRISIELSPSIFKGGKIRVLGVLLHQMIHAYYLQCCGHRNPGVDSNGYDLKHGPEFEALRQTIRTHFLPGEQELWDAERRFLRSSRSASRHAYPEAGSSDCYCSSHVPKKPVVERWQMSAKALTMSREAVRRLEESEAHRHRILPFNEYAAMHKPIQQYSQPENSYFMLQFQGKFYFIWKVGNPYFMALSNSHCFENGVLTFPPSFGKDGFESFYRFLVGKDYTPTLSHTLQSMAKGSPAMPTLDSYPESGPPYIVVPQNSVSPPFLLKSVASFNLAIFLNFEPLASNALQRLNSLTFTFEDPIDILEDVYQPKSMPRASGLIRMWARQWMSLQLPQLPQLLGDYGRGYSTNLGVLERHPKCAQRFRLLKEKSHDLTVDVEDVQLSPSTSRGQQDFSAGLADGRYMPDERNPMPQTYYNGGMGPQGYRELVETPSWATQDTQTLQEATPPWENALAADRDDGVGHLTDQFSGLWHNL